MSAKRARARRAQPAAPADASVASVAVGPRQPCPCGSGRRYKNCHGGAAAAAPFVARPFEGLPGECDWVALREFVPAATAPLRLNRPTPEGGDDRGDDGGDDGGDDRSDGGGERVVRVCSVLPMTAPALVRDDGSIWLGLQVQHHFGDVSRDLARALELAEETEPGAAVALHAAPGPGPRLQDLVAADADFEVTVHDTFEFWLDDVADPSGAAAASLEKANAALTPTRRLASVEAAYWCDVGTKEHLRWVMPHEEDRLLTALARLHAQQADVLVPDSRLVGSFRAHGLLVPVWDLPVGTGAEALEEPAAEFAERLGAALADDTPLTAAERSALAGLRNRQLTIR